LGWPVDFGIKRGQAKKADYRKENENVQVALKQPASEKEAAEQGGGRRALRSFVGGV